jgi:ABC-type Fe3+/spermidine/putrescine transport system ATPase subunit
MMSSRNILKLSQVSRVFGGVRAVNRLTLEIQQGEIFTLLGPSGCGKSTTLRLITGLERPDEGEIFVRDRVVASVPARVFVPPHKRKMGMVFQSYAIWPHLSVFENVAYPLRARGLRGAKLQEKVSKALALVNLQGLEDRPGPLLSGGQQQRVALARALVYEPEILLLDEPFSSLDAKLRGQMRVELKRLQRRLGITALLVTHDQVEALTLSDRIAVMESGQAIEVGSPRQLYEKPEKASVRDFLGKSALLSARIASRGPDNLVKVLVGGEPERALLIENACVSPCSVGQQVLVAIRPEDIVLNEGAAGQENNQLEGTITALLYVGDRYECHVQVGEAQMVLYVPRPASYREGETVRFRLPGTALSIWTP